MILHNTTEQYVTQYISHNGKDPPSPQWQWTTIPTMAMGFLSPQWQLATLLTMAMGYAVQYYMMCYLPTMVITFLSPQCATSPPWQLASYPQNGNEAPAPQWQWAMPNNTTILYSSIQYIVILHNILEYYIILYNTIPLPHPKWHRTTHPIMAMGYAMQYYITRLYYMILYNII